MEIASQPTLISCHLKSWTAQIHSENNYRAGNQYAFITSTLNVIVTKKRLRIYWFQLEWILDYLFRKNLMGSLLFDRSEWEKNWIVFHFNATPLILSFIAEQSFTSKSLKKFAFSFCIQRYRVCVVCFATTLSNKVLGLRFGDTTSFSEKPTPRKIAKDPKCFMTTTYLHFAVIKNETYGKLALLMFKSWHCNHFFLLWLSNVSLK